MIKAPSARSSAVVLALLFLSSCDAKDQLGTGVPAFEPPQGWTTACIGRLLFEVPPPGDFGQARAGFYTHGTWRYFADDEKNTLFSGDAKIAALVFAEGADKDGLSSFVRMEKIADTYFKVNVIRDGGPDSGESERAASTTKVSWRAPHSFIWRSGNEFDFGIHVPSDGRPRMLHGTLSGTGSAAQAKAVVDSLWPRYRPRKRGEIPSGPGICSPYGFFADPKDATERDYALDLAFRDPRHSNLVLSIDIRTRGSLSEPSNAGSGTIDTAPTPWDLEDARARESKEKCRPSQGTASRDIFGCTFAGTKAIKRHRDVEFLTLSDGQRARLLVVEYHAALHGFAEYEVRIEALGVPGSATQPRIAVSAVGIPEQTTIKGMQGKKPPRVDDSIDLVRNIALSLRLRPDAVNPAVPVRDTLDGIR